MKVASIAAKMRNRRLLADAKAASAMIRQAAVNRRPARVTCWRTPRSRATAIRDQTVGTTFRIQAMWFAALPLWSKTGVVNVKRLSRPEGQACEARTQESVQALAVKVEYGDAVIDALETAPVAVRKAFFKQVMFLEHDLHHPYRILKLLPHPK